MCESFEITFTIVEVMNKDLGNFYDPKLYERLGCTLQAYGANFKPDVFLNEAKFPEERILLKGAAGLPDKLRTKVNEAKLPYENAFDIFDTPFLLIKVSDAAILSLQIEEAASFLKDYLGDLKKLQNYPNVENVLIQFIITEDEAAYASQNLPAAFSDLYSESGIQGILFRTLQNKKPEN